MQFRTELSINQSVNQITYADQLILMGSCFSQSLGQVLEGNKFKTVINTFGTLYDPISIFRTINASINPSNYSFNCVENQGNWYSFECHSDLFANSETELKELLHTKLGEFSCQLKTCNYIFITLGTGFVYKHIELDTLVANCHKIPAQQFKKLLLDPTEIMDSFSLFHKNICEFNPNIKIIFTLSPVRHIKDGIENNQISKSILRYCISRFCDFENVNYFPSYELVLDDLRDYRFFKEDLIHPNEMATNYIWEKFCSHYFSATTLELLKKWQKVNRNMEHRPFKEQSIEYQKHLKSTLDILENLLPHLDVLKEINSIKQRLN